MLLKTTAAVVALLAGAGLTGCQDKPETAHTGASDRMFQSPDNNPVNGPPGTPAVGSSGDAAHDTINNDIFHRGSASTDANGQTPAGTVSGPVNGYNGSSPPPQPGAALNRTGTSTDNGGTDTSGVPGR